MPQRLICPECGFRICQVSRTTTAARTKRRRKRHYQTKAEMMAQALELIENIERMKRERIPIFPDHPPLH